MEKNGLSLLGFVVNTGYMRYEIDNEGFLLDFA